MPAFKMGDCAASRTRRMGVHDVPRDRDSKVLFCSFFLLLQVIRRKAERTCF